MASKSKQNTPDRDTGKAPSAPPREKSAMQNVFNVVSKVVNGPNQASKEDTKDMKDAKMNGTTNGPGKKYTFDSNYFELYYTVRKKLSVFLS